MHTTIKSFCIISYASFLFFAYIPQLYSQDGIQFGFSWTHEDIFISKAEGSDLTNIHMYGWGSLWPFPDGVAGEFDDGSILDNRIAKAVEDGQEVMITIATAPSNFRATGEPWNLEEKVSPEHIAAYTERVKQFLGPRSDVKYVQVWNEFKGYWNAELGRWDYEGYTDFYNIIYQAVKEVRPDILVGGGYIAARERGFGSDEPYNDVLVDHRDMDAMMYWMNIAIGFDAICFDGEFDPGNFSKLTTYIKSLEESNGKPIWWSEFYNASGTMQEVARDIASNLESGDKSIWWAEDRFLPFVNPNMTTSIDEIVNSESSIVIAPNPTTSMINITSPIEGSIDFSLYSLTGQQVRMGTLDNNNRIIDVVGLPSSTYILRTGVVTKKIILFDK